MLVHRQFREEFGYWGYVIALVQWGNSVLVEVNCGEMNVFGKAAVQTVSSRRIL